MEFKHIENIEDIVKYAIEKLYKNDIVMVSF